MNNTNRAMRRMVALVLVVLLLSISAVASALSKDELFNLKKSNVPDVAIISVLKTSGPLNLTKEDVDKLKGMGAGGDLLKFLEDNGHVLAESTNTGNGGGDGLDPAPEVAPAETNPDAMAEEAARLKAEEEARIRAKAAELQKADQDREKRQGQLRALTSKLGEGERLLKNGKNMAAAKIFLEFLSYEEQYKADAAAFSISGESGASDALEGEFYRARFGLAKALFKEKIYSGARKPLMEVVLAGPEKPHFEEGFYMLRTITRETGNASPRVGDLTAFYVENFSAKFQDDFHYFLGRFFFDYNKFDLAFKYLEKVSNDSPIKAAALYLTGVGQVDDENKQYRSAVKNFQNAILKAESIEGSDIEILELAYLALARVAYEATNYDGALFYYNKISKQSPRRPTALFESAWTFFLKNDYNRAVGSFHSLHSPYYGQWYFPDLSILEATVYLNLCKFDIAKESLAAFKYRYLDQQPVLQNFLQKTVKPEDYYTALANLYKTRGTGEDVGLPMIFAQGVYNNIEFYNSFRTINNLTVEQERLEANIARLGEFGEVVLKEVKTARQSQLVKAGIEIQQVLTRIDQDLTEWSIKADEIDFEIDGARAEEVKRALVNPDYVPPSAGEGTTLFVVADDWQLWPFEGEYWADEIGNYRSVLRTECIEE